LKLSFNRAPLAQILKGPYAPTPSDAEIDDAIQEFLAKGGTIQRIETKETGSGRRKVHGSDPFLQFEYDDYDALNDFD
jgi:hypothetical protein